MRNPYISAISPLREKRQREDEATKSDADMVVNHWPELVTIMQNFTLFSDNVLCLTLAYM